VKLYLKKRKAQNNNEKLKFISSHYINTYEKKLRMSFIATMFGSPKQKSQSEIIAEKEEEFLKEKLKLEIEMLWEQIEIANKREERSNALIDAYLENNELLKKLIEKEEIEEERTRNKRIVRKQ